MYEAADLVERLYGSDELLGPNVTEEIAEKAIQWLGFFAKRLGVNISSVKESFGVEELLKAYAFRDVCVKKSYGLNAPFGARSGQNDTDFYGKKLAYYENRIAQLEKSLTADDLTRGQEDIVEDKPYKGYRTVAIHRG